MTRAILLTITLGIIVAGCDVFGTDPEPEERFGEVTASLNGNDWGAFPRAAVVYTEDVYVPHNDSMLSMQFDAFALNGFRTGALVMTFPFRGVGSYEIEHTEIAEAADTTVAASDTLAPVVSFYDTQHNVINAQLLLTEGDHFQVTIDAVNRNLGRISGTFDGTLVFFDGQAATSPTRNYPDTLRFTSGAFESEVDFVSAEE